MNDAEPAYRAKRRVTLVGAAVNAVLAGGKIAGGIIGQSQALVVDGVHSLSDLAGDALVLWAARMGALDADQNHPYGHQRFETVGALAVGAILLLVAGGFAWDAITRLLQPGTLATPSGVALGVALLSVAAKEVLYHYTRRIGERTRSDLIRANAWHHRSDALSSVVVIVGVAGAMAGAPWLDAVAAIVVALMVGGVGMRLGWHAGRELVDTGLSPEAVQAIGNVVDSVTGVRGHDDLRTRRMGALILVSVRIRVDPALSVTEAHRIADAVSASVQAGVRHMGEVFVRVAPDA